LNCPGRWWHCPHLVLILLATRDKVNGTTAPYREREARGRRWRRRKAGGLLDEIWMVDRMVELCKVLRVLAVALGPVLTKWLTRGTRVERRRRHDSRGPRLRHGSQGDANPGTNLNVPRELVQITADKKCMRNNRTRDKFVIYTPVQIRHPESHSCMEKRSQKCALCRPAQKVQKANGQATKERGLSRRPCLGKYVGEQVRGPHRSRAV
jgi:hypothetical protein